MHNLKPIAIYLPQFHPVKENNEWWGKGFTEWTNVTKAKPLYEGHYQPHLPSDLGFYDLRLAEVRELQASLAKQHGIQGFCYYHYWFNGRRILERPFQEVFESGKPDFPFMLCWANENWTRRWDGLDKHVLLEQNYSDEDDLLHIQTLIPFFKDTRYIRINNKPVFAVYKSTLMPNMERSIQIWRTEAAKHGIELYICRFEHFGAYGKKYMDFGFDASIEFQPFSKSLDDYIEWQLKIRWRDLPFKEKLKRKFFQYTKQVKKIDNMYELCKLDNKKNLDYNKLVDFIINEYQFETSYTKFPGICPSWDNTARRGNEAFYLKNANPDKFKQWLEFIDKNYKAPSTEENLLFINAWNEWAEGNHLEPCLKWGNKYLEAVKDVFVR